MRENHKAFVEYVKNVAESMRDDAGHNGRMDDGGAGRLEDTIMAYDGGVLGIIPASLDSLWQQFKKEKDTEYQEYQRLKAKFESEQQPSGVWRSSRYQEHG
jgi:hypothetical protein